MMKPLEQTCATAALCILSATTALSQIAYPVPDTQQEACYNASTKIPCPAADSAFFGQDAQVAGPQQSYIDNGDGTVTDDITGLMWMKSPDLNGDGVIRANDKLSFEDASALGETLAFAGYDDWRLPTIKEMYSLMSFNGVDPSGYEGGDTSGLVPFIDTEAFDFGYGDTEAGERIIDSQMASSTLYVSGTMAAQDATMFGVNFADGRIKGYGLVRHGRDKMFYVMMVRGEAGYGDNAFADNGDGTVTDATTGLMWTKGDSGEAMSWEEALAWATEANAESYLGHSDWRLPNVKELQILVDYTRAPDVTGSAAIDPVFDVTEISNEAGEADYPAFWSSTTHVNWTNREGAQGSYVNFGRAMGYMRGQWVDVHGAGAQRSDPKVGNAADYPEGHGPQGDAIRIKNFARLVREAS